MIYAWYWTIICTIGCIGAFRNLKDRKENLRALRETGTDGDAIRASTVFRNSEYSRLTQIIIMWIIGVFSIWLGYNSNALGGWLAKNFGSIVSVGLCLMATLLTLNILYFGHQGRKIRGAQPKD